MENKCSNLQGSMLKNQKRFKEVLTKV